ncbi:MAG: MBL fold metallo-hydrolase [Chloroflexota bacterium]
MTMPVPPDGGRQGAQIYVHPVGAPHLVDPSKPLGSATRIYGEMMDQLWGEVLPAPADRVTAIEGDVPLTIAGLNLTPISTPGHAWHHHTYRLEGPDETIAFTGDALGIHLPHVGVADLPAPPPEFHLETWRDTLDRIESEQFDAIYPTHFSRMDNLTQQLAQMRGLLADSVAFVEERYVAEVPRDQIVSDYLDWNHARLSAAGADETAVRQMSLANPLFMSVDGILRYLRKREG